MITFGHINVWAWVAWIVVGLIVGLMAGRVLGGRRLRCTDLLISVIGSCLGGWGSDLALGDSTPQLFIISVLVALFVSGGLLWLLNTLIEMMRRD